MHRRRPASCPAPSRKSSPQKQLDFHFTVIEVSRHTQGAVLQQKYRQSCSNLSSTKALYKYTTQRRLLWRIQSKSTNQRPWIILTSHNRANNGANTPSDSMIEYDVLSVVSPAIVICSTLTEPFNRPLKALVIVVICRLIANRKMIAGVSGSTLTTYTLCSIVLNRINCFLIALALQFDKTSFHPASITHHSISVNSNPQKSAVTD